jgi:hypothetical protein
VNTAVGICYADHVEPSIRKRLALTSPTSGGHFVGIGCSQTEAMEFSFLGCQRTFQFRDLYFAYVTSAELSSLLLFVPPNENIFII